MLAIVFPPQMTGMKVAAVIQLHSGERLLLVVKSQRPSQIACQIPDVGIDVESGCSEPARRGHELCVQSSHSPRQKADAQRLKLPALSGFIAQCPVG